MSGEISKAYLSQRPWMFSNQYGHVFSTEFELGADGDIRGYEHPNERTWRLVDDAIELIRDDGTTSCILARDETDSEGQIVFKGAFIEDDVDTVHYLRQNLPSIGCFLRTHYWDEAVQTAFDRLRAVWSGKLFVASDQTRPFAIPPEIDRVDHAVQNFTRYGLPLLPEPKLTMWHNGDYVLYDLLLKTDFNYFIVCEYDLAINTDLMPIIRDMIVSGCDFVASHCQPSHESWEWHRQQSEWDTFESEARHRGDSQGRAIYGCFFPFIFISRQAIIWLYSRRIQMSALREAYNATAWPFCESFVPTELARAEFTIADLGRFVSGPLHMTTADAYSWAVAVESNHPFVHPVFLDDRFADKIFEHAAFLQRTLGVDEIVTLRERLNRCGTEAEVALLEAKILSLQE